MGNLTHTNHPYENKKGPTKKELNKELLINNIDISKKSPTINTHPKPTDYYAINTNSILIKHPIPNG